MRTGGAGGAQHGVGVRRNAHPGDVLGDRSVEQLHRLREKTDMPAETLWIPLVERSAIEPHAALGGPPYAHEGTHQRGLAGAARACNAERLAGFEAEIRARDDRRRTAWRDDEDLLDVEAARRRRQRVLACRGAARVSASDSRVMLCRAAMKPRQFAIAVSIGASARPIMMEAAIIAPAVSSCLMTR